MLRRKTNLLKRTVAAALVMTMGFLFVSCGKIPTETLTDILDDDIGATRLDLEDLNSLSDIKELDPSLLSDGVYITESMENIEDRFEDEVEYVVDFADERFDIDIDTSLITDGTLYFRKSPENDNMTMIAHIQFKSRHAANSIIQGIIASARAGGRPDVSSVSASDVKKITKDELYYNLISRGYILIHCDEDFINDITEDALGELIDENLPENGLLSRRAATAFAMNYLEDHYPQYIDAEAAIGIYYEYDSIMIVVGYTGNGGLEDLETLCEAADLGNPMDAENSDLILEFAASFLTTRLKDGLDFVVDYIKDHALEIITSFL